jgi:uncharacterized membrane protein YbjE (DUF340 family)
MTILLMIILAFSAGMFLGIKKRFKTITKYKILPVLTCVLLFSMGTEIGTADEIFDNLASIGLYAFLIALFAVTGSFLMTFIYTKLKRSDAEEADTHE